MIAVRVRDKPCEIRRRRKLCKRLRKARKQLKTLFAYTHPNSINSSTWFHALDCKHFTCSGLLVLRTLIKPMKEKVANLNTTRDFRCQKFHRKFIESHRNMMSPIEHVVLARISRNRHELIKCWDKCWCLRRSTHNLPGFCLVPRCTSRWLSAQT